MPTPVINSSLYQSPYRAKAFSYTITATNTPTSFSASTLPAGLSVNTTTGVISGTTTAALGQYNITIGATNGSGTGTAVLVLNVVTIPLKLKRVRMPRNYSPATGQQFFRDFVARLKGGIPYNQVLLGTIADQNYNAGPWVDTGFAFRAWDDGIGAYTHIPIAAGDSNFLVKSSAQTLTADHAVMFQDKGVAALDTPRERVALLADVYIPRDAFLLAPGTLISSNVTLDPTLYEVFYGQIHENITIIFTVGIPDGKTITIGLINDGTSFTVTWPGGIKWPAGMVPTQPIATSAGSGIGIYEIENVHGTLYGKLNDETPALPTMTATFVTPPKNYANAGGGGAGQFAIHIVHLP